MLRRLMSVVILFFIALLSADAQMYHRLTVADMAGAPTDAGYVAYTNCYVGYSYQPTRHNGVYNIDFNVQLYLNTNRSWIKMDLVKNQNMLQEILKHEQGHYNIAWLMRNELYSVFTRHRYSANYQYEIASLFKQIESKYHKMNEDYENQTQHMDDAANQQKWNTWFNRQLNNREMAYNGTE
jgi:hypothetical protein